MTVQPNTLWHNHRVCYHITIVPSKEHKPAVERRCADELHQLVILVRIWNDDRLRLLLLATLGRSQANALALVIQHLVLILDELDRLAILELLHCLGKSCVEDLAAVGRTAGGVEGVDDVNIDRRRGRLVVVGGGAGRFVGDDDAFKHVDPAADFGAVFESSYGALGVAAPGIEVATAC